MNAKKIGVRVLGAVFAAVSATLLAGCTIDAWQDNVQGPGPLAPVVAPAPTGV